MRFILYLTMYCSSKFSGNRIPELSRINEHPGDIACIVSYISVSYSYRKIHAKRSLNH